MAEGRPVLKTIQARRGVSRAGAAKHIRQNREMGLLGWPAHKGEAGTEGKASPYAPAKKSTKTTKKGAPR